MSTRRARIKAVAVLPPRRKNVDANKKNAPSAEAVEKELKSPKTPRSVSANIDDTPAKLDVMTGNDTLSFDKTQEQESTEKEQRPTQHTPNPAEKVSVITSTSSAKSVSNSFASPLAKKSPRRPANLSIFPLPSPSPARSVVQLEEYQKFVMKEHHIIASPSDSGNLTPMTTDPVKDTSDFNYNVPSVPESVTDDGVMDGIMPLQAASSVPKPLDLLKNEIISENAEVVFDPIVPLPSPSKVRPKLRPIPRLAPMRRNSIQGSASESEDESRRALLTGGPPTPAPPSRQRQDSHTSNSTQPSLIPVRDARVRNDSVCSSVSQIATQPAAPTSPIKEKHFNKIRRQEMGKRMWRRRRDTVKRDALTMYDLIFYNPTTNPIIPDKEEMQAKEANAKEEAERLANAEESDEEADDPPEAAPVPQIKLGPNGEIILDEKSLVIKQSDAHRKVSMVVREGAWAAGGGGRYTRAARTADWRDAETVRFYRALAALGTDFSLMAQLFPDRTRKDLKLKFKKEERLNGAQVDKALRSATTWDVAGLQDEFREEREESAKREELERKKLQESMKEEKERQRVAKEMKMRLSKGSKAIESKFTPFKRTKAIEMTADDIINRALARKNKNKRKPEKEKEDLPISTAEPAPPFATLTLMSDVTQNGGNPVDLNKQDMVTISKVPQAPNPAPNPLPPIPPNIENGSLVVLRVSDPKSPAKTMLQTYISHGDGKLTPIALPASLLSSVMGYMKAGKVKSTISTASSPQVPSPGSSASQSSRSCATPTVIQLNPSPAKRQRHSSFTITTL